MTQGQRAYLVHRTAGRLRLKIPGQRHNAQFFENLRRQLSGCEGVIDIQLNVRAASIAIVHRECFDLEVLRNRFLDLDMQVPGAQPVGERSITGRVADVDRMIRTVSGGEEDLPSVLAKVAVAVIARPSPLQLLEWIVEAALRAILKWMSAPSAQIRRAALTSAGPSLLVAA